MVDDDAHEATTSQRYQHCLEVHRRIEALYPRIEERRAFFRNLGRVGRHIPTPAGSSPVVDRD